MVKIKESSKLYFKLAVKLALSQITIKPCLDCGRPVREGYCCYHCGSRTPTNSNEDESAFYIEEFLK